MRGLARPFLIVVTLLLVFASSRAQAWTDATVRTGTAEIALQDDGYANVTMRVRLRVNGGWLEGFDIEGLDRDAVFDPAQPPVLLDETGIARPLDFTPRSGGRIQLRFRRASAPRRGEYEIELHYRTHLDGLVRENDDGSLEVSWVFPAWRYGLDDVEVVWIAPTGTRPFDADTEASPIDIVTSSSEAGERILYRRPHLPRTSDWTTRIHVAQSGWAYTPAPAAIDAEASVDTEAVLAEPDADADLSNVRTEAPALPAAQPVSPAWHASLVVALIAIGAWLKVRGLALRARLAPAFRPVALLPLPSAARHALVLATLATATLALFFAVPREALMALAISTAALGWYRFDVLSGQPRMAQLHAIPTVMQRDASRERWRPLFSLDSFFDPARLGLVSSGALATLGVLHGDAFVHALCAAFFLLVMGSSTRAFGQPFAAIRTALPLASTWRRAGFDVQLVGRSTATYTASKPSGRVPANEVRVRTALRSGPGVDVLSDGRVLLHFPDASPQTLIALQTWADEQGASIDMARRLLEAPRCTPAQVQALDAQLQRAASEENDTATQSEDATLQDAAE